MVETPANVAAMAETPANVVTILEALATIVAMAETQFSDSQEIPQTIYLVLYIQLYIYHRSHYSYSILIQRKKYRISICSEML